MSIPNIPHALSASLSNMTSSNGNIGIGTTTPISALHVIGQTISNFPVHLSLYGTATTTTVNTYYSYVVFPISVVRADVEELDSDVHEFVHVEHSVYRVVLDEIRIS